MICPIIHIEMHLFMQMKVILNVSTYWENK